MSKTPVLVPSRAAGCARAKPVRPIGVFDSGIGGLTVAAALRELLPSENIFYLGDTARVPYGGKSAATIERYSMEISGLLLAEQAKIIVVACNTASALAVPRLQEMLKVPVIGVIEPGARAAVAATRNGRIGVIGTRATVYSRAYERAIHALREGVHVTSASLPAARPADRGRLARRPRHRASHRRYHRQAPPRKDRYARARLHALPAAQGRHPAPSPAPRVTLVDSAHNCALAVRDLLKKEKLAAPQAHLGRLQVALTDASDGFLRVAEQALALHVGDVQLRTVQGGALREPV